MGILVSILEYKERQQQKQNEREYKEFMGILNQFINAGEFHNEPIIK